MGLDKNLKINIGTMKKGKKNLITDVRGVSVGQVTLDEGYIKTGVTAILPHKKIFLRTKLWLLRM